MKLINELDVYELASKLLKMKKIKFNEEIDFFELFSLFEKKFEIDIEKFTEIASYLIKLTNPLESQLSKKNYHAFGVNENGFFIALAKLEQENGN